MRIEVVTDDTRNGFIVAVDTGVSPASAVVVGQVHPNGARCQGWLWKQAGTYPERARYCEAITEPTPGALASKLRKRHQAQGPWWTA